MKTPTLALLACFAIWVAGTSTASAYYNSETGRFLSLDPIGIDGGVNLYGFVGNDPINHWDYLGLKSSLDIPRTSNGRVFGPFKSVGEAGRYGAQLAEAWAVKEFRVQKYEVGGRLCYCECTKEYGITDPRTDFSIRYVHGTPCPKGWVDKGDYHSHPPSAVNHVPSPGDKAASDPESKTSSVLMMYEPKGASYTGDPMGNGKTEQWERDPNWPNTPVKLLKCGSSSK